MGQKSQYDALSFQFFTKNHCSNAYILSKKPPFSKKHNVLIPIFYQKIVHSLKNTVLSSHFFIFFLNHLLLCPYLVQKGQLCQNHTILWAKKVNRMPFYFRFSAKKPQLSCPYFVNKTSIL